MGVVAPGEKKKKKEKEKKKLTGGVIILGSTPRKTNHLTVHSGRFPAANKT